MRHRSSIQWIVFFRAVLFLLALVFGGATAAQENTPGAEPNAEEPDQPQQLTVRDVPDVWIKSGEPTDDPVRLRHEADLAQHHLQQTINLHGPDSDAVREAAEAYRAAMFAYYTKGLGLKRVTPPPKADPGGAVGAGSGGSGSFDGSAGPDMSGTAAARLSFHDAIVVNELCYQDLVVPISKDISGAAGQQADVEWTIHGFVLDQHKRFVPGVAVRLRGRNAHTISDSAGYYRLVFNSPGFAPTPIRRDLTLRAACIEIEPHRLTLGPVAPGGRATARARLVNSCDDRTVEVHVTRQAGSSDQLSAAILDCSSGAEGGLMNRSALKATLGPGTRCTVEVSFVPTASGPAQATFDMVGDDLLRCTIPLVARGVACSMARLDRQALEFVGVKKMQLFSERLNLSNASPHTPLTITKLEITGRDAPSFMARLGQVRSGSASPVGTSASLMPGGRAEIIVDLGAPDAGIKQATLVIHTSDPDAQVLEIPLVALVE